VFLFCPGARAMKKRARKGRQKNLLSLPLRSLPASTFTRASQSIPFPPSFGPAGMTEIYEVSAPSDRAEEVIKWLASKGLGEAPVKALFDAAARQNFAAVISGALEDSAGILRSGADDGARARARREEHRALVSHLSLSLTTSLSPFPPRARADVEGAFTLILSLLSGVSAEDRKALVKKLAEVITSPAEGKGALVRLRVCVQYPPPPPLFLSSPARALTHCGPPPPPFLSRSLSSLYNNLKESTEKQSKLEVLRRLISYATETRSMEALRGYLQQVSGWTFLTQEEAATLYLLISTSYQKLGMTDEEQHFLVKYLSTFEGVAPEAMAAATHAARSAAINYIRAPAGSQKYHVPRLQAVSPLRRGRGKVGRRERDYTRSAREWDSEILPGPPMTSPLEAPTGWAMGLGRWAWLARGGEGRGRGARAATPACPRPSSLLPSSAGRAPLSPGTRSRGPNALLRLAIVLRGRCGSTTN
jgi:hypothetical protein